MPPAWVPVERARMTPLDFDLIQKVCQIIACKHAEDISAAHLDQWPRVMRLSCPTCQTTILIKQFSRDFGVNRQEQRRRFQIERKSFETLCSFGLADGKERIPRVLGYIEDPHFAIVEEYCDYGELLKTITRSIAGGGKEPLYKALGQLVDFLVRLHRTPYGEWPDPLHVIPPRTDERELITLLHQSDPTEALYKELLVFLDDWEREILDENLQSSSLVHDELTPMNILYSEEREELIVLDLETSHRDTPFVDVGTVTAELKFTYALHHGNPFHAEPFISFFLREYYSKQTMFKLPFTTFSYYQTFFMGRRLLTISRGTWLDHSMRRWALELARDAWGAVKRKQQFSYPKFKGARAVLFDFYNTLVSVRDDEGDIKNFKVVRDFLANELGRSSEQIPSGYWLRDRYFTEIRRCLENSRESFPDFDLGVVWSCVLGRIDSGIPVSYLYRNGSVVFSNILERFRHSALRTFQPFEGVVDTIKGLKEAGLKIGIISDAQPAYAINEIERAGLFEYLDCLILSADFHYRKPDRRLFLDALDRLQVQPHELVFVGDDMYRDIYGAMEVGMKTVYKWSPWGVSFYGDCIPDAIIGGYGQLESLLGSVTLNRDGSSELVPVV